MLSTLFVKTVMSLRCQTLMGYTCTLKCLRMGTPKTITFPFVPIGNLMVLDVPIYKHIIKKAVIRPNFRTRKNN